MPNMQKNNWIQKIVTYFSAVNWASTASNNQKHGLITKPVIYLHNTVAKSNDTYTVVNTKKVTGVGTSICNDFSGNENCTLIALYNILIYYRRQGYSKIPKTNEGLYEVIKAEATELGYNDVREKGLSVTKNDNLVKNVWKKGRSKMGGFGYSSGTGSNNYLWTRSTAINLIDNDRPFMFSLASGKYYNHTVTVYGYKIYQNNRTGKKYTFLMLRDGWDSEVRYLAWTNTREKYVACLTSIIPPNTR